jgi:sorbitol/mannitol transport system permease protein
MNKSSAWAKLGLAVLGWFIAALFFFPIFWIAVTAFKSEGDASTASLIFQPTLDAFAQVFTGTDYFLNVRNSIFVAFGSTILCFILAIPSAYRMAFYPTQKTQSLLLLMLSTKMMPAVGVLIPIYFIWQWLHLFDTVIGLVIVNALMNLPIAVWMAYTYFSEVPKGILEAGRIDGATAGQELWHLLRPMTMPGLSSTALLLIILAWNEAFWSLNLTAHDAAPLTAFIASQTGSQGQFLAQLSAASLLAVAPIMVMGWFTQKQLVSGLTFGAVK